MGDVAKIMNGKDYKQFHEGDVPVYGTGGIMCYIDNFAYDGCSVLLPRKGTLSNVLYVEGKFWTVDTMYFTKIDSNQMNPKFLYHWVLTRKIERLNTAGGVPSLTQTVLNRIPVPVPSLIEQARIVAILDKFDALTTDITAGLPAEITARRKQYEYYRDKLLTFKEKAA